MLLGVQMKQISLVFLFFMILSTQFCVTKIEEKKTEPALFLLLNNSYKEGSPSILTGDCTGTKTFDFSTGIPSCWSSSWGLSSDTTICPSSSSVPCLASPSLSVNDYANAQFKATTSAGNIVFSRRVDSISNTDYCQFFIDGVSPTAEGSGASGNLNSGYTFALAQGTHVFRWTFKKLGSYSYSYERCAIDSITIP
jgi:hypothetical protein